MTTIDNKCNTIIFDDSAQAVMLTHKPPRNSRKKVEYGPLVIPYGAIADAELFTPGVRVHGYTIKLKDPVTQGPIRGDLYGVWIHSREQEGFKQAITRAAAHDLATPWEAPQLDTFTHRLNASATEAELAREYAFGELCITGGGVLTYKGHEFPVDGARATIDHDGVKQKVGAGRVIGGAVLAGPAGAIVGGMAKKNKGEITLTVQLTDGRALSTTGPVKQLKQAQDVAERINDAGLGI